MSAVVAGGLLADLGGVIAGGFILISIETYRTLRPGAKGDDLMEYKVPLVMTPQPEGGYTVTSPALPELVTEGDTLSDALENAKDALAAVIELYEEDGRSLPRNIWITDANDPVWFETVIAASDVP